MSPGAALDARRFARALGALRRRDRRLARLLDRVGDPPFIHRRPGFRTLARIVLEQQVSLAAAAAVFRRLEALVTPLSPAGIAAASDTMLRGAGLSGPRIQRLRAAATACLAGDLDLRSLSRATDDDARRRLTLVHGIGPWTADIYLLFALRRPDIWPAGDHALAVAVQRLLRLAQRPAPRSMEAIGARWAPWRGVAAHALWHAYLSDWAAASRRPGRISTSSRARRRRPARRRR